MPSRQYLTRLITVRYLIALTLVAVSITASVVMTGTAVRIEREGYRIVGLASEQRLASQRIPFLANAYVSTSDEELREAYRNALQKAVAETERRHEILSLQSGKRRIPGGMRSILKEIYLNEPRSLKDQVDRFLGSARAVLEAETSELHREMPHLVRLNLAGGGFLLNTHGLVVNLLRYEESAALDRVFGLHKVLWFVTLIILVLEVPLIFRPMARRASQTLDQMDQARLKAESAAAAAEAAREGQAGFIRTMSHELRTPLNAILGMNQLLRMSGLYRKQREYTEDIDQAGRHLLGLIDEILEFSRLEAKQVEIRKLPTSIKSELESSINLLKPLAASKGLQLVYRLDERLAESYRADGLRIRQVLMNIVGNGIKFTSEGYVAVRAVLVGTLDSGTDIVRFEVRDTGIGVPSEARERIFQEFQQVDNSLTRKYGGSGLGLAVCNRLVKLMNGEIGLECPEEGGSVFWFTLPLQREDLAPEVLRS